MRICAESRRQMLASFWRQIPHLTLLWSDWNQLQEHILPGGMSTGSWAALLGQETTSAQAHSSLALIVAKNNRSEQRGPACSHHCSLQGEVQMRWNEIPCAGCCCCSPGVCGSTGRGCAVPQRHAGLKGSTGNALMEPPESGRGENMHRNGKRG